MGHALGDTQTRTRTRSTQGFTLIEMLIVVGLIGILASISYGAYTNYVRDSFRAEAQSTLLQFQQAMERFYTENNTYAGSHTGGTPNADVFPSTSPPNSSDPKYTLSITSTDSSYTLTATPVENELMEDDGTLTLEHTGQKTHNGNNSWE